MDFDKLREPFPANGIEWRLQTAGEKDGKMWAKCLAYVTNRAIMDRLDSVAGPANWKNEYVRAPEGGILCGISIKLDGEWVTKWDGAENTDIEAVKGGLSGAMKRAAVQWGIGRYLYDLEEGWANISTNGAHSGKTKDGKWFKWDAPTLPAWALPASNGTSNTRAQTTPTNARPLATVEQRAELKTLAETKDLTMEQMAAVAKALAEPTTQARAETILVKLRALPELQEA